jgi:hypothetical protein
MHFIHPDSWTLREVLIAMFILMIIAALIVRALERLERAVDDLFLHWEVRRRHITARQLNRDRWASNYRSPAMRDFK